MDKERAFEQAFRFLKNRIGTFISLPLASLDQFTIGTRLREIGHLEGASIGVTPENAP
jgi:arsenate reductase